MMKDPISCSSLGRFGPKSAEHPSIGNLCPACQRPFVADDFTTLVCLGPGENEDSKKRALGGRPYNAVAIEVHWACATGGSE